MMKIQETENKVLIALVKIGDTGIRKVKTAPDGVAPKKRHRRRELVLPFLDFGIQKCRKL